MKESLLGDKQSNEQFFANITMSTELRTPRPKASCIFTSDGLAALAVRRGVELNALLTMVMPSAHAYMHIQVE
jgi:hypothetical protein